MALVRITSLDDPGLAPFRHVADPKRVREQGLFVAEGRRVVEDLLRSGGGEIERLLLTQAAYVSVEDLLPRLLGDVPVLLVEGPADLRAITGYRFHQGCLGLVRLPPARGLDDLPDLFTDGPRLVTALEGVTDPDNVGTIFRSARAFASDAVLLSSTCAHPLYRKALRTSMGAALRVPFGHPEPWPVCLERLAAADYRLLALTPAADALPLDDVLGDRAPERAVLLLGSEERGLDEATLARAHDRVRIPTEAAVDSLNVAATAAIALSRLYRPGAPAPRG